MLSWQMHHAAPRRHQICPFLYTCTTLMLANCLQYPRRHRRRRQSPLRARTRSLHACVMPARVHRARMPCGSLRESYVCSRLLCLLVCIHLSPCLIAYGLHGGCAQAPLNIPNIPPCPLSQATTIGGGPPPSIMGARRRHLRLARGSVYSG